MVEFWSTRQALPTTHPLHAGRDPTEWVKDADVILTIDALVPWIADHVQPPEGCTVIALGADPQFRAAPMRSFATDLVLAGGTGPSLEALASAMGAPPEGRPRRWPTGARAVAERREAEGNARAGREPRPAPAPR